MVAGVGYAPCCSSQGPPKAPRLRHDTLGALVPPRGISCCMHEYRLADHVYLLFRYYKIPVFSDSIYAPVVGGLRCSVSEKNYPCPLVCVVLLRHTPYLLTAT